MNLLSESATTRASTFLTSSAKLEHRWDPNYYLGMAEFHRRMQRCIAPILPLRSCLDLVQYGISERATEEPVGVPMLRMLNLQDDTWDLSDLKYIAMSDEQRSPYLLEEGDILFNRTNSKELVGKCGVFDLPGEYVFASYLIRVRLRKETLLPDYLTAYLSSSLGRIQINAVSRQIAGMTNINAEEIRDLLVPMLSLTRQQAIVSAWRKAIVKRDSTLDAARELLASIDDVLLAELGVVHAVETPYSVERRIFSSTFSALTGQRWDPLPQLADVFAVVRKASCKLEYLGNKVEYMVTGFAAGRNDQADEGEGGILQIRPTNVSDDRELIFNRNVYVARSEAGDRTAELLRNGEVLFNNTNSQELVGKTVVFGLKGDYFCSNHMTRIGVRSSELNPTYLAYILNLYQRRRVFYKLCTNWNNQSGVGPDVLRKMLIPLPSLSHQKKIATRLEGVRARAKSLQERAREDLDLAKKEIEGLILGKEWVA